LSTSIVLPPEPAEQAESASAPSSAAAKDFSNRDMRNLPEGSGRVAI
jgi:hypothetical protein